MDKSPLMVDTGWMMYVISVTTLSCFVALEKETALSAVLPNSVPEHTSSESTGVSVDGLAASWTMEPDKLVLSDISFSVHKVSHLSSCVHHVTTPPNNRMLL